MRALLLLAALALPGSAAESSRFELAPAAPSALIGAPVELSGEAVFPERFTLQGRPQEESTEPFTIVAIELGKPVQAEGQTRVPVRIKAAAFALGDVAFPALTWTLAAQGGDKAELKSPPVRLKVTGPQPEEKADIRDIAGPFAVRVWPWLLLAGLLAALLAWHLWRNWKDDLAAPEPAAPVDDRTPDEIALDELRALSAAELPVKEYYDRLSDILRLYLDRRFGIPGLQMTTGALHRALGRGAVEAKARTMTKQLLDRCDLAKFARLLPSKDEAAQDCASAIEIVERTKPAPAAGAASSPEGPPYTTPPGRSSESGAGGER